jgi:hypothetical protein
VVDVVRGTTSQRAHAAAPPLPRIARLRRGAASVWAAPVAVFALGVATRAPFAGAALVNWDSVQYALGMGHFDVVKHQPHPPGSILYVALARLLLFLAPDANAALVWISVVAGAAGIALCYVVGDRIFGRRIAVLATVLFAVSPLAWFYGIVALPYALEGAMGLAIAGLCWRAAEGRSGRAALAAAVLLAVAGGVRQTTMLLLLPLWLFAAWRAAAPTDLVISRIPSGRILFHRARYVLRGVAILVVVCVVWAVPLLALSGGVGRYLLASRALSTLVSSLSSVTVQGLPALVTNVSYLGSVAAESAGLALVAYAVFLLPRVRWPWHPTRAQCIFFALWAGPALAVFSGFHTGQAGYLLLLWPLACYTTATAVLTAAAAVARRTRWPVGPLGVSFTLASTLASSILFLAAPLNPTAAPRGLTLSTVRENDTYWRAVVGEVRLFPDDSTVVLTGTGAAESFRHATYYLPEYHVAAIGPDRTGDLGVAFQGYEGAHDYDRFMAGDPAARTLALPAGTHRLVILDASVARLFPPADLRTVQLTPHRAFWLVAPGGALHTVAFPRYASLD